MNEKGIMSDSEKLESVLREMRASAKWIKDAADTLSKTGDGTKISLFVDEILSAPRIFLMGAGRSRYEAQKFVMRLMQLDFSVFVIGETTTPRVKVNDLVIAISGGGETESIVLNARIILGLGAKLATITSVETSTLGKLANITIILPGRTKENSSLDYAERRLTGGSTAPLGSLFENTAAVFLDSVTIVLMNITGQTEMEMKERHANPD